VRGLLVIRRIKKLLEIVQHRFTRMTEGFSFAICRETLEVRFMDD